MNREHPTGTERKSLNYECGWKGGDRAAWLSGKRKTLLRESKKTLDTDRPSHGRPSLEDANVLFVGAIKSCKSSAVTGFPGLLPSLGKDLEMRLEACVNVEPPRGT